MNKLLRLLRFGTHRPDIEALSAHLDGQLDAARSSGLETHLSGCAACREFLDGMRADHALLQSMPEADAPRSFRLRAVDVEAPAREPAPVRGSAGSPMRWAPMLGGAAAVIFVVVLSADILTRSSSSSSGSLAPGSERNGMLAAEAASQADTQKSAAEVESATGSIKPPDTGTSVPDSPRAGAAEVNPTNSVDAPAVSTASNSGGTPEGGEGGQSASSPGGASEGPPAATTPFDGTPSGEAVEPSGVTVAEPTPEDGLAVGNEGNAAEPTTASEPVEADPTGAPPDGDAATPGSPVPPTGSDPASAGAGYDYTFDEGATPTTAAAPATGSTAVAGVIVPDSAPVATNTPAEVAAFSGENTPSDGNRRGLRIVEIAAAAIAVAASVAFIAWRWRRRGDAS